MKIGIRKPNIKSSIKAKTVGKVKRDIKRAVNSLYGKTGMGVINDPKRALYNKIYNKTTVSVTSLMKTKSGKTIEEFSTVSEYAADIDLDSVAPSDIDIMTTEALQAIYQANQGKRLDKESKKKLERIEAKIIFRKVVPYDLDLADNVKTKSGKARHEFPTDFRYLADLDLSTITLEAVAEMDIYTVEAIYNAKNTSLKRKEEKAVFKMIEQRHIQEVVLEL